jgi:hypothetical protein
LLHPNSEFIHRTERLFLRANWRANEEKGFLFENNGGCCGIIADSFPK